LIASAMLMVILVFIAPLLYPIAPVYATLFLLVGHLFLRYPPTQIAIQTQKTTIRPNHTKRKVL
jgi:hypothetical protein